MNKYDVIVIGNGISAITSASYLSKRMRNVALFLVDDDTKVIKGSKVLNDQEGFKYAFTMPYHEFGGLEKDELLAFYLNRLGVKEKFKVLPNLETTIVTRSRNLVSRPNDLNGFKLYLVRHYPKSRDAIHRFFDDLQAYYENFKAQKQSFLRNEPYTITALQAAWGTQNLKSVLMEYFDQPELIREFGLMQHSVGLELDEINAYFYFIRWFNVIMEQSYFIQNSYEELNRLFIEKNPYLSVFKSEHIEAIEVENDEVRRVITNKGTYEADYVCINAQPRRFINNYLKEGKGLISKRVDSMFKEKIKQHKKHVAYIGLNTEAKNVHVYKTRYLFDTAIEKSVRLLSVLNYKKIYSQVCESGRGALLVEFLSDSESVKEDLLRVLERYFKGIEKHLSVIEISEGSEYSGSYDYAKDQERSSLTKRFQFEKYQYVNVWKNTYFMGSYTRPEAGITGLIQMGIDIGALIDFGIDYQIRESKGVTPDVLINIVANQVQLEELNEPLVAHFIIGKNTYTIVADKEVKLKRGLSGDYNVKFKSTIEGLYDIAVNCRSLEESEMHQMFELEGNYTSEEVYRIFRFGKPMNQPIYPSVKPFGMAMFFTLMLSLVAFSGMALYLPLWLAATITLSVQTVKFVVQSVVLRKVISLDVFMMAIVIIILIVSLFTNYVEDFMLGVYWLAVTTIWFFYKLLGYQVTGLYLRYDYHSKYAYTSLFFTMMRGLSSLWFFALVFVTIGHFVLLDRYQSIALYIVLMMLYLTYRYPSLYIQNSIEKGGD